MPTKFHRFKTCPPYYHVDICTQSSVHEAAESLFERYRISYEEALDRAESLFQLRLERWNTKEFLAGAEYVGSGLAWKLASALQEDEKFKFLAAVITYEALKTSPEHQFVLTNPYVIVRIDGMTPAFRLVPCSDTPPSIQDSRDIGDGYVAFYVVAGTGWVLKHGVTKREKTVIQRLIRKDFLALLGSLGEAEKCFRKYGFILPYRPEVYAYGGIRSFIVQRARRQLGEKIVSRLFRSLI